MKLTDGKRIVEINMYYYDGENMGTDWSEEIFDAGALKRDDTTGAYIVDDVDYCIGYAEDWKNQTGDFTDNKWADDYEDDYERILMVTFVKPDLSHAMYTIVEPDGDLFTEKQKLFVGIDCLYGGWLYTTDGDPITLNDLEDCESTDAIIDINDVIYSFKTEWHPLEPEDMVYVKRWLATWGIE